MNDSGHMTQLVAMTLYIIYTLYITTFQNLLLQNRWTDFIETWHKAIMTKVLHYVYKSCDDLDLIYVVQNMSPTHVNGENC